MLRAKIMMLRMCSHGYEIPGAVERWEEQDRNLCEDDREITLPDSYKNSALKTILCGKIQMLVEYM